MGYHNGPKIVTDGLIMLLDAANRKSYPGTGSSWKDISGGQSNNATNNGATWNSEGYFYFNSDYMDLNNDLGYEDDVSIFALFRIESSAAPGNYHIITGGQEMEMSINTSDTFLRNGIYTDGRYVQNDGTGLIVDDVWHYAGFTHTSAVKKSYHNGVYLDSQSTGTGNVTYSFSNRRLGRFGSSTDYYLVGDIAVVMVYDRALSGTEILQNYNAYKGRMR